MIRKTMRMGEKRTSIKLEPEFWDYLKELATEGKMRVSQLVNKIAAENPERSNLASTLRTHCLTNSVKEHKQAKRLCELLRYTGNTFDLTRLVDAVPIPCLILNEERRVVFANPASARWLTADQRDLWKRCIDHIFVFPGNTTSELFNELLEDRTGKKFVRIQFFKSGTWQTANAHILRQQRTATAQRDRAFILAVEKLVATGEELPERIGAPCGPVRAA